MDYKPGDFFLGIIDFFGILVPGAVLLLLRKPELDNVVKNFDPTLHFDPARMWVWGIFFLAAYVVGHFLVSLGRPFNSMLKVFYPVRKDDYYEQIRCTVALPGKRPHKDERRDAFYQAYAFVRLNNAAGLAEIERQMADYKLFRSLMLVFAVDFAVCLFRCAGHPARMIFSVLVCILAASRFVSLLHWTYKITFQYYALLKSDSQPAGRPVGAGE